MSNEFNLTAAISGCLNEYGREIREEVEELIDEVAGETLKEIKANSPVGEGKKKGSYKKGWRKKPEVSALGKKTITVYNTTDYQLAHLLENGHLSRNGTTRVSPIKHIKPAEEKAVEKFEKGVEEIIKNAGRNL